jgi:hypothetical protein
VNAVGNDEVLMLIGFCAASENGFGLLTTCNDLNDGETVDSAMLCVLMCLTTVKIVAKATPAVPLSIGKHETRVVSRGYGCAWENSRGVNSRVVGPKD